MIVRRHLARRVFRVPGLLLILLAPLVTCRSAEVPPTLPEIVERAAANDEARRLRRLPLEYDQTITTERLDAASKVLTTRTVQVVHREGQILTAAAEPIPADQAADAADAARSLAAISLPKLAPHFLCTLQGEGKMRGRDCYIVGFSPRPDQDAATREEKVLNHLRGRFWIDQSTFEILRGEGALATPVSVAVVASITQMNFSFVTQTLPNGEAGPADFQMDLMVKAPFYFYRQRQRNRLENWRPAAAGREAERLR